MKLEESVQRFIESEIKILSLKEILELISKSLKKTEDKRKKEKKAGREKEEADEDKIAGEICKKIVECTHPVVGKLLNWGYIKGVSEGKMMYEIKEVVKKILTGGKADREDTEKLEKVLKEYKEKVSKYLLIRILGRNMFEF
ncbi:MAG: hypothetical protein QXO71_11205 [Candidatus Jordarchaeaceae archaeon]